MQKPGCMTINTGSRAHLLVYIVIAALANGCVADGEDEELDEELEGYRSYRAHEPPSAHNTHRPSCPLVNGEQC